MKSLHEALTGRRVNLKKSFRFGLKATEDDYGKAIRIAEYIMGCGDEHSLILAPKSLQLIARSDASSAEHKDGRSHTRGFIGFESDTACWFMWVSSKQPVMALSTHESDLNTTSIIGCGVEWGTQFLQELGPAQLTIEIGVDNKCAMHLLESKVPGHLSVLSILRYGIPG